MTNCLQCNKPLVHVPGRKQKSFCDGNCRNKYFYAKRKDLVDRVLRKLDTPKVKKAMKESIKNLVTHNQAVVHIPTMKTGATLNEVKRKVAKEAKTMPSGLSKSDKLKWLKANKD